MALASWPLCLQRGPCALPQLLLSLVCPSSCSSWYPPSKLFSVSWHNPGIQTGALNCTELWKPPASLIQSEHERHCCKLWGIFSFPSACARFTPAHTEEFELLLAGFHEISSFPALKFLKVHLGWNSGLQHVSHSHKSTPGWKPAEETLCHCLGCWWWSPAQFCRPQNQSMSYCTHHQLGLVQPQYLHLFICRFFTVPKCAWQFPGTGSNNNKKISVTQISEMYIDLTFLFFTFPSPANCFWGKCHSMRPS